MEELAELEEDIERQEAAGLDAGAHYMEGSDDEDDDESVSISQSPERRRHRVSSSSVGRRLSGAYFLCICSYFHLLV